MSLLRVDGKVIPDPSSMNWSIQDVSDKDTGRTMDAKMHKKLVAAKRKLELSWPAANTSDAAIILQAFDSTKSEFFSVTYWDAMDGKMETRRFYRGDANAPVLMWVENYPGTGKRHLYQSIKFNIIEE